MRMMWGGRLCARIVVCLILVTSGHASAAETTAPTLLARGEYLTRAAGCAVCHTDADRHGAPFAGGRALHTPFGTFYSPNITPDKQTGIGNWSEADFQRALHDGKRPDGSNLYPVFPYTSYTQLHAADVHAMWAYLRSIKPVQQANRTDELKWYAPPRFMVWFWKKLYFHPGRFVEDPQRPASWNRGAYLVNAVAHCAECHTPRNLLGAPITSLRFAGADVAAEDFVAPNITPAPRTGIGDWSTGDLVQYLQSGLAPDGDTAGSVMAEFIDDGLSHLTQSDLQAIAEYIRSLPPIEHEIQKKKKTAPHKKPEWD